VLGLEFFYNSWLDLIGIAGLGVNHLRLFNLQMEGNVLILVPELAGVSTGVGKDGSSTHFKL